MEGRERIRRKLMVGGRGKEEARGEQRAEQREREREKLMVHLSSWQRRLAAHLLLHRHSSTLGPFAASARIRAQVTIHRRRDRDAEAFLLQ